MLIWRIHNLRFTQPSTHSPARSPAQTAAGGSGDTLPRGLAKAHLGHHVDLIGQGDDYVLIAAVLEIVGFDHFIIALDGIRVLRVLRVLLKHLFQTPGDDKGSRGGDDGGFLVVDARVEAGGREGEWGFGFVLELCYVAGLET